MAQKDSKATATAAGMGQALCRWLMICMAGLLAVACSNDNDEGSTEGEGITVAFNQGLMGYDLGSSHVLRAPRRVDDHEPGTEAEDGYRWYSPDMHPTTLGMWADCDGEEIWSNLCHNYANGGNKWTYAQLPAWGNDRKYTDWQKGSSYEFCCYMPYEPSGVTYSSGVLTIANQQLITNSADLAQHYYITHDLLHANGSGEGLNRAGNRICPEKMDLIYARYQVEFKLGAKMSQIRKFRIKGIDIYDTVAPAMAKFARNYNAKKDIVTGTGTALSSAAKVNLAGDLTINAQDDSQWLKYGTGYFYVLKGASLEHVRMDITYDVYDLDGAITRQNVKSSIDLTIREDGLGNFTATGHHAVNRIQIQIVPRYLYVMSENDDNIPTLVID